MLANSSNKPTATPQGRAFWRLAIALPLWVVLGFGFAQILLVASVYALRWAGVPLELFNETLFNTVFAAVIYLVSLLIVIGVPWWLKNYRTSKQDLGLTRLPSWMDITLAPAGFIVYFLCSALLVYIVGLLVPGFNINQVQDTGFTDIAPGFEHILAFLTLVVIAPVAEEILFRGYLYGKLRKGLSMWVAIPIVSVLFGLVHGQWNVGIDVFALSVILCSLREVTGSIWAGILLHMLKNSLAFYLLFINPQLLNTMGG